MTYVATQILEGLAQLGIEVDYFVTVAEHDLPDRLTSQQNLRAFCRPPNWQWGRWYSRNPLLAFITGQGMRAAAQFGLTRQLMDRHMANPYDCVYQFSQIEAAALRRLRDRLPRIIMHPQVHAAGELYWHREEAALGRACETASARVGARALLLARSAAQRRDIGLAAATIAPSARFAEHLAADYGFPLERIHVVPNPIDLDRFTPPDNGSEGENHPLELLYVSRISVRKGVEMVVALSHRLVDLAGRVRLVVVGDESLWSSYRSLLSSLHPSTAEYTGFAPPEVLPEMYRGADALLQPSQYEPFGLTVGEALASGLPVIISAEVGAGEGIDHRCARVFPRGDMDALEATVRALVSDLSANGPSELRRLARTEAERMFGPRLVAERVAGVLEKEAAH